MSLYRRAAAARGSCQPSVTPTSTFIDSNYLLDIKWFRWPTIEAQKPGRGLLLFDCFGSFMHTIIGRKNRLSTIFVSSFHDIHWPTHKHTTNYIYLPIIDYIPVTTTWLGETAPPLEQEVSRQLLHVTCYTGHESRGRITISIYWNILLASALTYCTIRSNQRSLRKP